MENHGLTRLTELWHKAYELIRDDKRSREEINILLDALQAFREKRLAAIVTNMRPRYDTPEAINAFCEARIADSGMPEQVVVELHKSGFVLQGELFQCQWYRHTYATDITVLNFLAKNGFPQGYRPFPEDWTPSYFTDPAFHTVLNASAVSTFRIREVPVSSVDQVPEMRPLAPETSLCIGGFSTDFVGQALQRAGYQGSHPDYRQLQALIGSHPLLHAGMIVPIDWTAPDKHSPEWYAHETLRERAIAFRSSVGRNYGNRKQWELPDDTEKARRREALTAALVAEQMDLWFFHIVVIENGEWNYKAGNGDHFYITDRSAVPYKQLGITSIRQLLRTNKPNPSPLRDGYACYVADLLKPWDLSLGMTQDQLDELFGAGT